MQDQIAAVRQPAVNVFRQLRRIGIHRQHRAAQAIDGIAIAAGHEHRLELLVPLGDLELVEFINGQDRHRFQPLDELIGILVTNTAGLALILLPDSRMIWSCGLGYDAWPVTWRTMSLLVGSIARPCWLCAVK